MAHALHWTRLNFSRSVRGAEVLYRPSVQTSAESVDAYVSIFGRRRKPIEVRSLLLTYALGVGELGTLDPVIRAESGAAFRNAIQPPASQCCVAELFERSGPCGSGPEFRRATETRGASSSAGCALAQPAYLCRS